LISSSSSSTIFSASIRLPVDISFANSGTIKLALSDSIFISIFSSGMKEAIATSLYFTSSVIFKAST